MGNVLEFFVRMRDMMSGGLGKIANTAQKTFSKVQGSIDRVTGRNKVLSQSFDELERKIRETERAINASTAPAQIRAARRELAELQRLQARHPAGRAAGGTGGGVGFLGGLGRSIIPALGMAGVIALGSGAVGHGLQAQQRQTSFEVLAGKDAGGKLNTDLTKFAQDSIFGTEIFQNAQTMLGFGLKAESVMPTLRMLGDVSMGDAQKLNSLTLAFSQVQAAGRLTGQDLLQFINAGFNPLQAMSEKTGLSLGVLKKRMEDGAISADMVRQAFEQATGPGGRFHDMTNRIAQTDFGKVQAFQGQLEGLAMQVGGMLAPALGNLITNYLAPFVEWLGTAAVWLQQNWDYIGGVVAVLAGLAAGIGVVSLATSVWTAATAALNLVMAMNPISLVVIAIAALVAGIIYAYNRFGAFRGAVQATFAAITGFGNLIKEYVVDRIKGILSGIGGLGKALGLLFSGEFSKAWDTAKEAAGDLLGVEANAKAMENAKKIGKDMQAAYRDGLAGGAAKAAGSVTPTAAVGMPQPGAGGPTGPGGGAAGGIPAITQGITGGGPRTININGVKFTDKIEIHTATLAESEAELEARLESLFLRILNSGAAVS